MQFAINHAPSFASLTLTLNQGDKVRTEAGAMVAMSENLKISTKAYGGFFRALIRKLLGGESVFMNTYEPEGNEGELVLSPKVPGDITHVDMDGGEFILQGSAYLASDPGTLYRGRRTVEDEVRAYHREMERAFSAVTSGEALPIGASTPLGVEVWGKARAVILDQLILPYNRLLGQKKKNDSTRGYGTRASAAFYEWLSTETPVDSVRLR